MNIQYHFSVLVLSVVLERSDLGFYNTIGPFTPYTRADPAGAPAWRPPGASGPPAFSCFGCVGPGAIVATPPPSPRRHSRGCLSSNRRRCALSLCSFLHPQRSHSISSTNTPSRLSNCCPRSHVVIARPPLPPSSPLPPRRRLSQVRARCNSDASPRTRSSTLAPMRLSLPHRRRIPLLLQPLRFQSRRLSRRPRMTPLRYPALRSCAQTLPNSPALSSLVARPSARPRRTEPSTAPPALLPPCPSSGALRLQLQH